MMKIIRTGTLLCVLAILSASPASAATFTFPSAGSTVVGSIGFIDADEIGFFWSVGRGDSVQQTFADPLASVDTLFLELDVLNNVLSAGQFVNWDVLINGTTVGNFTVNSGFVGDLDLLYSFAPIASPGSYTVRLEVTNEVPGGGGSHTFAYAGAGNQHSVTFRSAAAVPEPASVLLFGSGVAALVARRQRRRKA